MFRTLKLQLVNGVTLT